MLTCHTYMPTSLHDIHPPITSYYVPPVQYHSANYSPAPKPLLCQPPSQSATNLSPTTPPPDSSWLAAVLPARRPSVMSVCRQCSPDTDPLSLHLTLTPCICPDPLTRTLPTSITDLGIPS